MGIPTVFRLVDTCAAEFEAETPYYYSSYGAENEVIPSNKKKIIQVAQIRMPVKEKLLYLKCSRSSWIVDSDQTTDALPSTNYRIGLRK